MKFDGRAHFAVLTEMCPSLPKCILQQQGGEHMNKGIDVSSHQGAINWEQVKSDAVEFAILRAGYGRELSQKDTSFERNFAGCM